MEGNAGCECVEIKRRTEFRRRQRRSIPAKRVVGSDMAEVEP